jgi:hypothetical protein
LFYKLSSHTTQVSNCYDRNACTGERFGSGKANPTLPARTGYQDIFASQIKSKRGNEVVRRGAMFCGKQAAS